MTECHDNVHVNLKFARGEFLLDVNIHLPARGTTVIFGASGCGKSSLLRAIAGLEPAADGDVRVGDEIWQNASTRLPPHRRATGVVFQHSALLPHLSVIDNLRYGWKRANAPRHLLDTWVARLALAPLLLRKPESLSGGERQRVALARALVTAPKLLLLDEPLSALDAPRRAEILPYLEAVRRDAGIPIVYVTHAVEEVARLADHLVLMEAGHVVASGSALDVLNRTELPLALREDAGVVLEAELEACDAHGLLRLGTQAGTLFAHGVAAYPLGTRLRVRIQARDVSLALTQQADSSLLNLLPATLTALIDLPGGQVQARLDANGAPLLARISHRSLERLQLHPGQPLWAQIKAVALLV